MLVRFQTVLFSQEGWAEKRSVQFGHRQCSLRCGNPRNGAAVSMAGFLHLYPVGHRVVRLTMRLSDSPTTTLLLCEVLSASGSSNNRRKATVFCRDADLFTQQKRASPRDGLITQSTRKAVTAGALFCFVEKPT